MIPAFSSLLIETATVGGLILSAWENLFLTDSLPAEHQTYQRHLFRMDPKIFYRAKAFL